MSVHVVLYNMRFHAIQFHKNKSYITQRRFYGKTLLIFLKRNQIILLCFAVFFISFPRLSFFNILGKRTENLQERDNKS